ncbi:MAG: 1-(5-phosphoribosyl)-5-[(5-phosphoribosylamino)methylideneamino]imidazole-4-carboxamide isomerase [Nitrospirae bacterium]|nr:1-(5-phosphoribosyl)-5-[(5-phosphoribosylamino)methylideneamino]imidazole-4-carboxamide isomerase [Candidatus Troglogloeales bacterium]
MIIIPAIDIKNGQAVRLMQGDMNQATVYSESPLAVAKGWIDEGATRLHVVDLDGAITGRAIHFDLIKEMIKFCPIPVQVGGGIREISHIENYLAAGAAFIVLGTAILQHKRVFEAAVKTFPGRIIAGIDCKDGKVAIRGWIDLSEDNPIELAHQIQDSGIAAIILTDIQKDGMMAGPNIALLKEMAANVELPIIASGGITTLDDIKQLNEMKGVDGAIVGKALYSGKLSYKEAARFLSSVGAKNLSPKNIRC